MTHLGSRDWHGRRCERGQRGECRVPPRLGRRPKVRRRHRGRLRCHGSAQHAGQGSHDLNSEWVERFTLCECVRPLSHPAGYEPDSDRHPGYTALQYRMYCKFDVLPPAAVRHHLLLLPLLLLGG